MCSNNKARCPYCLGTNLRAKGWKKKKGLKKNRRYKCKDCKKHIMLEGSLWFVSKTQINLIDKLLLERIALRAICRVVEISLTWLLCYVKKLYSKQPDDLNYCMPKRAEVELQVIDSELDEMWSFVQKKKNKQWIWIAQCRETRQVIAFHVGSRKREDAQKLWKKLPDKIQNQGYFYSDDWDAYKGVFPKERHHYSTQKKETNHLERLNCTIRQRVSRLVRKSLSFSKIIENHIGALKYFFANYNLEKQIDFNEKNGAHL